MAAAEGITLRAHIDRLKSDIGETYFNLLMVIDSYHDFKNQRAKKTGSCVGELDAIARIHLGLDARADIPSYLNTTYDITYSKIEPSTRNAYEKQCYRRLHGAPSVGVSPIIMTYSDFLTASLDNLKLEDTLVLERDEEYTQSHTKADEEAKDKEIGLKLVTWFLGKEPVSPTEIGLSFDAKYCLINDLMMPYNNKTEKFYAKQIVFMQNILDSAKTSFTVLPGILNDNESRVDYDGTLVEQYSNFFTKDKLRFAINKIAFNDESPYNFKWQIIMGESTSNIEFDGNRTNGPSVGFLADIIINCSSITELASMITCKRSILDKEFGRHKLLLNQTMLNPFDFMEQVLKTSLRDPEKIALIRSVCFDMKRLGDHEQANAVWQRRNVGEKKECFFVTGDILSALYSRLIENPTIFVNTSAKHTSANTDDEGAESEGAETDAQDDDENEDKEAIVKAVGRGAMFCYRGASLLLSPTDIAQRNTVYSLNNLNYVLTIYHQFAALREKEGSLHNLFKNINEHGVKYIHPKINTIDIKLSNLVTMLVRLKADNTVLFIEDTKAKFTEYSGIIALYKAFVNDPAIKSSIVPTTNINTIEQFAKAALGGFNINLNHDAIARLPTDAAKISLYEAISTLVEKGMNIDLAKTTNNILQGFNNYKFLSKDGKYTTTYSFAYNMFFSDTKVIDKLTPINFNIADITNILTNVSKISTGRMNRNTSETVVIQEINANIHTFLDTFYTLSDNAAYARKLEALYDIVKTSTKEDIVENLIRGIMDAISDKYLADPGAAVIASGGNPYVESAAAEKTAAEVRVSAAETAAALKVNAAAAVAAAAAASSAKAAKAAARSAARAAGSSNSVAGVTAKAKAKAGNKTRKKRGGAQTITETSPSSHLVIHMKTPETDAFTQVFQNVSELALQLCETFPGMFLFTLCDSIIYNKSIKPPPIERLTPEEVREARIKKFTQAGGRYKKLNTGLYGSTYPLWLQYKTFSVVLNDVLGICKQYMNKEPNSITLTNPREQAADARISGKIDSVHQLLNSMGYPDYQENDIRILEEGGLTERLVDIRLHRGYQYILECCMDPEVNKATTDLYERLKTIPLMGEYSTDKLIECLNQVYLIAPDYMYKTIEDNVKRVSRELYTGILNEAIDFIMTAAKVWSDQKPKSKSINQAFKANISVYSFYIESLVNNKLNELVISVDDTKISGKSIYDNLDLIRNKIFVQSEEFVFYPEQLRELNAFLTALKDTNNLDDVKTLNVSIKAFVASRGGRRTRRRQRR